MAKLLKEAWMVVDWNVAASCASAAAAVVALLISLRQGRMANRQSLFDRRLKIWITVEKLMQLYRDNSALLKQGDEPQFAIGVCFEWLTNTTFLKEISPAIYHPLDDNYRLKLHLKLDQMKSLSTESALVFEGKPKTAISEFVDAHQTFLSKAYRYQVLLNAMQEHRKKFHWTLDDAIEAIGEKRHRAELCEAEVRLASAYEIVASKGMIGKIRRQIRLASTPLDYLSTFR